MFSKQSICDEVTSFKKIAVVRVDLIGDDFQRYIYICLFYCINICLLYILYI